MNKIKILAIIELFVLTFILAGCGSSSSNTNNNAGGNSGNTRSEFKLGGTVSGLSATGLILSDGVAPTSSILTFQTLPSQGGSLTFSFDNANAYLASGTAYDVTVQQQPTGNRCAVSNGSGTISSDVSNILTSCEAPTVTNLVSTATYAGVVGGTSDFGPESIAVDNNGNVYAIDRATSTFFKIAPSGAITIISLQNSPAGPVISSPALQQVAIDQSGNIFVAAFESGGGCVVQKVTLTNSTTAGTGGIATQVGLITTVAGSGSAGSIDGTGTAASFGTWIKGLAVDSSDNIYVADFDNNKIRKITSSGVVTTLAGSGMQGASDGAGTSATFNLGGAQGNVVAVDSSGNVYVVEWPNADVRKITPAGIVSTIAGGNGRFGETDGSGTTVASFSNPMGIAIDGNNNIYILDGSSNIRMIMQSDMVSTLVNNGSTPIYDSNNNVISSSGMALSCIASSPSGNLYAGGILYTTAWSSTINKINF